MSIGKTPYASVYAALLTSILATLEGKNRPAGGTCRSRN